MQLGVGVGGGMDGVLPQTAKHTVKLVKLKKKGFYFYI